MLRTQIQLEEDQYKKIKELASQQQISIAAVIRQAVDQLLLTRKPGRTALYREALKIAGKYSAGQPFLTVGQEVVRFVLDRTTHVGCLYIPVMLILVYGFHPQCP